MESKRLEQVLNLLKMNPKDSFLLFAAAREYSQLEQSEKALEFFEKLRLEDPEYSGTYYHYGQLLEKLGNQEKAIEIYREGMNICRNLNDLHSLAELEAVYAGVAEQSEED